jgi:adenine/guanine phosphoribosyltransferase-like PRPP-binding protein
MSQFIACKNYDERITTIHTSKVYDDTFNSERKLIHQQVQKNKRILLVDDWLSTLISKFVSCLPLN